MEKERDFAINLAYWRIDKNYRYRYIYYYYFQKKPTEFQQFLQRILILTLFR